jgi:tRNA/tmRNA/rRNA uracil-C5-methylase (TrmA/RlmC/RlmD family)
LNSTAVNPTDDRQIAVAFDVEPELVAVLPELLADIWVLGSWPEKIVGLLRGCTTLPERASVVDLGCGKGAVAIPLARELGFTVHGTDLFPPFVEEAVARAASAGVADLCRFEVGDVREAVQSLGDYDAAVFAGVGAGLWGDYSSCVGEVRRTVRSGGLMVIDDGFLEGTAQAVRPGYEYYRSRDETVEELTSQGDQLVREVAVRRSELEEYNRRNNEVIRWRADEIAQRRPGLAEALERFVQSEVEECEFLESETTAAIWLLEKC